MDKLIRALQIFLKYGNPSYPTCCEHDVMYVMVDYDSVSDDDKTTLEKLGFIHEPDNNMFQSFVFGSA